MYLEKVVSVLYLESLPTSSPKVEFSLPPRAKRIKRTMGNN